MSDEKRTEAAGAHASPTTWRDALLAFVQTSDTVRLLAREGAKGLEDHANRRQTLIGLLTKPEMADNEYFEAFLASARAEAGAQLRLAKYLQRLAGGDA